VHAANRAAVLKHFVVKLVTVDRRRETGGAESQHCERPALRCGGSTFRSARVFANPAEPSPVPSLKPETGAPLGLADCLRAQKSLLRALVRAHEDNLKVPW